MKALFVGRFQPFHKGHLRIIKEASEDFDEIIIGIGSSQYSNTFDNPFTDDERKEMIKAALKEIDVSNYRIVNIPDIHNPPRWVFHVLSIVSDFDVVISNNRLTLDLFKEKKYKVKQTPLYNKKMFSGKEIRRRIREDNPWKDTVPEKVKEIILKIDGVHRIKKLSGD